MISALCSSFRNTLRITPRLSSFIPPSSLVGCRPISTTPYLLAEPLKKKKKLDPAVIKAREDRRKRKLEKQIRRLEKHAKQLKPLDETEVPIQIVDRFNERLRQPVTLSTQEEESRWLLEKKWARHQFRVHTREIRMMDRLLSSQQKALEELKAESEELYQAAIQMDFSYIPCEVKGPVDTPPIKDYDPAEGDYINVSKKWD